MPEPTANQLFVVRQVLCQSILIIHQLTIYKFTCASCNACYVGQTVRHFKTCIQEHLFGDRSSHLFRQSSALTECCEAFLAECFKILDTAQMEYQITLKESMHIKWLNPVLNHQLTHINLSLS